jgi:hypothetical protein
MHWTNVSFTGKALRRYGYWLSSDSDCRYRKVPTFSGEKMTNTTIKAGLCAFGLLAMVSGCAEHEKKELAAAQAMPINCATAPGDLRVLNSEKASTASKIGNGISMIAPIGLVAGLVTGTEKTKYEVSTGEYNKALDTKIAQIKAACPGT